MILILTSLLKTRDHTNAERPTPIALDDENGILSNIRRYLKRTARLVVVANDQYDFENNNLKLADVGESFRLTGLPFAENILLDARNKALARELILGADLVMLTGGKCTCQNAFFNEINLKAVLSDFDGVVIGISAGTMNSCKTIANFPEELSDLDDPRWLDGMGFVDDVIIPHYDGETDSYQFDCDGVDAVNDHILPLSFKRELIGLPNGSYLLVDGDGNKKYYGDIYSISNGKSKKL